MPTLPSIERMFQAMEEKDTAYAGVFFIAVKTTKIFCRPGCPARAPKKVNIEFFATAREAIDAGYRPCKRCKPLENPHATPEWVTSAMGLIEERPGERILESDLEKAGISSERLRRWFKQNHNMTFQAYQRGLRLGQAMSAIKNGDSVQESALFNGWESTSGFREAFHKAFGTSPQNTNGPLFKIGRIETPLGALMAIADDEKLYLLEFVDRRMLPTQIKVLQKHYYCSLAPGDNQIIKRTKEQLHEYFKGTRTEFGVPLDNKGTAFQQSVWERLKKIPYGETMAYGEMATDLGCPDGQRAVGKANGDNRIAIIVPCHRVVRADGTLCGYGGGLWRKRRLLELEQGSPSLFEA